MARGRKKSEKAEGAVERPVDKHQLIALIKESYTTKERTSSIAGAFGERVKAAVENGRLNKKAFSFVCSLHSMEELKRQAVIRDVQLYLDMIEESGLWGHRHAGDLVENMQDGDEDEDGDDQPSPDEEAAEANADALRGLTQLSDGEFEEDMAKSGGMPGIEPAKNAASETDIDDIPPALERRPGRKKAGLTVVENTPVH